MNHSVKTSSLLNMTTVTFIRHGESEANVMRYNIANNIPTFSDNLFDSPLTDIGRKQALDMQKAIKNMHFDAIVVSPLIRACETAAIIFEHKNVQFHVKRCCREIQNGSAECQGRLKHDIINGSYKGIINFRPAIKDFPGGVEKFKNLDKLHSWSARWNNNDNVSKKKENKMNIQKLKNMFVACRDKHICIVCHGSVIRLITGVVLPNCGMFTTVL